MSCLFHSLSFFINNVDETQLRMILVDYIKKNPVLIPPDKRASEVICGEYPGQSLESYVEEMKDSRRWGGAIEIKAFCELFSMQVNVHVLQTGKKIEFLPYQWTAEAPHTILSNRCINISWNGYHYEPIR